jgi:hypothetical protein
MHIVISRRRADMHRATIIMVITTATITPTARLRSDPTTRGR